jgi:hypothetical protein
MRRGKMGLAGLALLAALALVITVAAGPAIAKKITGSKGNERIVGTKKSDRITGKGGTDLIKGKGGNDKLRGGKGGDRIVGGKGVDRHLGGPGNDVLKAADGRRDSVIDGGSGTNRCIVDAVELSIVRNCDSVQGSPQSPAVALVRATLNWDATQGGSNIDLDLWVFDTSGNRARAAANTIPNTAFSPNAITNPGTETFTDLAYTNPGARNFSFGVCYQDGGSQHVRYSLDYVTADGLHHTASEEYGSDGAFSTFNGGAPIPSTFCKAP